MLIADALLGSCFVVYDGDLGLASALIFIF